MALKPRGVRKSSGTRRDGRQLSRIAAALRHDIVTGVMPPGGKVPQERIAERFAVSRIPVRDALRQLEGEGLVTFIPNRGARVAPLGADDLREICEMRVALETLALRCALPELSNAQLDQAAALQDALESAPVEEFGVLNTAFHEALYAPARRPRLLAQIEMLGRAADRFLRMTVASLDYAQTSHDEHRELLSTCRSRDEAAAVSCLTRHIEVAGDALLDLMAKADSNPPEASN